MQLSEQLKHLRKLRGFTLEELANRCGLTKGYLSRIENGHQTPAVSTIQVIADALDSDIADLLNTPSTEQMKDGLEIKRSMGLDGQKTSAGYSFLPLLNQYRNKQMSPFLMIIEKGETRNFSHDSEEFFYVAEGSIELIYRGQAYALSRGDSAYFDSREKHSFRNLHDEKAVLVTINYHYRRF
jgi:transcriptional regulator with XRE-family HTH domain